ncbi:hypothetical protein HGA34_05365 [Candidatus Falkowbacteria bacterium]|nr:hypothetical protein [Candidatus Falkowbacteria bacterium]
MNKVADKILLCCIALIAAPICLIQVPEVFLWPYLDRKLGPRFERFCHWINKQMGPTARLNPARLP